MCAVSWVVFGVYSPAPEATRGCLAVPAPPLFSISNSSFGEIQSYT